MNFDNLSDAELYEWYKSINVDTLSINSLLEKGETLGNLKIRLNPHYKKLHIYGEKYFNAYASGRRKDDNGSLTVLSNCRKLKETITNIWVELNNKGLQYEKTGNIDDAISAYEENIYHEFDGTMPYTRLAIIYRKMKKYDDEIRVVNQFIKVFSYDFDSKMTSRIVKAIELKNKQK